MTMKFNEVRFQNLVFPKISAVILGLVLLMTSPDRAKASPLSLCGQYLQKNLTTILAAPATTVLNSDERLALSEAEILRRQSSKSGVTQNWFTLSDEEWRILSKLKNPNLTEDKRQVAKTILARLVLQSEQGGILGRIKREKQALSNRTIVSLSSGHVVPMPRDQIKGLLVDFSCALRKFIAEDLMFNSILRCNSFLN